MFLILQIKKHDRKKKERRQIKVLCISEKFKDMGPYLLLDISVKEMKW